MATTISLFIYIVSYLISSSLIYAQPSVKCDNSTGSCIVSCSYNNSCHDFKIDSKKFIRDNLDNPNQYISNLTSLTIECTEEDVCDDVSIDCSKFGGLQNCTIGCLADDSCKNMTLSCSGNNIKQCFMYTIESDSAMAYSLIDCKYNILSSSTHFCGYKCGEESDGCYEDNICLDHGYQTKCACKGLPEACDEIFFESSISTTTFMSTTEFPFLFSTTIDDGSGGSSKKKNWLEKILANTTDDVLIFGGIGLGIICLICFILVCICGYRIKNGKIQKVAKEYKVENKTLSSRLLTNDAMHNGKLGKNNKNGKQGNNTSTDVTTQESAVSYDDNAELGSFKMIPDAELGDGLFNSVVVDDDDDY
mmetsp:Transcript_557/g.477  ORF Transcript_557/g.477 Transcript_557/m.477 type:complete len:363 (-) Transcript_557:240-1328(-)